MSNHVKSWKTTLVSQCRVLVVVTEPSNKIWSRPNAMGRCNNQRAQAAAQALQNMPARARFSKGGGRGGRGRGRGRSNESRDNPVRSSHDAATPRPAKGVMGQRMALDSTPVVTRIRHRVAVNSSGFASHTKSRWTDAAVSQFDELRLLPETFEMLHQLLMQWNIIQQSDAVGPIEEEEADPVDLGEWYDQDVQETDWEPQIDPGPIEPGNPVWIHLTQHLSFSPHAAGQAIRSTNSVTNELLYPSSIERALDWLILHLPETELQAGLRTQSEYPSDPPFKLRTMTVMKAVPHPSISIAPKFNSQEQRRQDEANRLVVKYGIPWHVAARALEMNRQDCFTACQIVDFDS
jgi:hypothetical protein